MIEHIRGDTLKIVITVRDSENNLIDLTDYEIRAEIKGDAVSIKKANSKVPGGSDDEIKIIDTGKMEINFSSDELKNLEASNYNFEVEITSPDGVKTTIVQDLIKIKEDIITWESK